MKFTIYNEDCVTGMASHLDPDSVDLCVTSIPFGQLFMYSGKKEDIGNNQDGVDMEEGQFGLHMRFFCEQLFRVVKPGHNVCIHIQQLLAYKNQHGWMGRRDFRNAVIFMFREAGFAWTGEVCIPKNPQAMAQRLSLHSLMFVTGKRNSRDWAPAVNDFIIIFQRPGEAAPCRALWDAEVNREGWMGTEQWIKWASGVWDDIREIDVLDGYRSARETDEERHVCPLQLSVIFRLLSMYSAPGELVLDPFMGIGSSAYVAVGGKTFDGTLTAERAAVGFELKESYFALAIRNLEKLERDRKEAAEQDLFAQNTNGIS
jgi:DNA modification methylase